MNGFIRGLFASTHIGIENAKHSIAKENSQLDRKITAAEESINRFSESLSELNFILLQNRKQHEESQKSNVESRD